MARLHFGSNRDQAKPKKVVGRLRKTQLITTFGNGSIVDMPDYSVIMAGANYWKDNSPVLHEPNLEKLLKVSCFKEPYVSNSQDDDMTPDVPAFRFPYYHFCPDPNCGRLMPYWGFGDVTDRSCANGHPKRNIVPSRFIAACTNGHLEDFPYEWWVHYGNFSECPADKRNGALRISFSDETGGLDSIVIKCTACGKSRTMAGSMAKDALRGYSCHGKRPWLGSKKEYNDPVSCTAQLRVLQRGASNVYFSMTASALTIPPWSSKVQQEIAVRWEQIEDILDSNPDEYVLRAVVQSVFHSLLEMQICTIDELISEIKKRYNDGNGGEYTKQNLLEDEYRVFCMGDYDDPEDVQFRIARATVPEFLEDYIEDEGFYPDIPAIPNQYLVSEVFGDLPAIPAGGGTTEPVPTAHYDGQYLYESGIKEYDTEPVTFHQARPHTDQDLEIYRIVVDTWNKNGTRVSYIDLPANLRTHQNTTSFLDRFKVVAGNLPHAQTIVAHIARDGHYFIHPDIEQNRSITPREAARIQTFPDNYYFESKKGVPSRTLAFKQIGNAVPVCLAYHVATALLDRFDEQN